MASRTNGSLAGRAGALAFVLALGACAADPPSAPSQPGAQVPPIVPVAKTGPCCGPVTPAAQRILDVLDGSGVEHLWAKHRHVNWETGEPDMPADYHGRETQTHCSAFAAAIGERLDVYLLRPPEHAQELLANAQTAWFGSAGGRRAGWYKVDSPQQAQVLANLGKLVVASYPSPDPHRPGHIGIVRPDAERTLEQIEESGVLLAQAGARNAVRVPEKEAFRHHAGAWPNGVQYFAHDVSPS
jgi:hypothetical protein